MEDGGGRRRWESKWMSELEKTGEREKGECFRQRYQEEECVNVMPVGFE